MKLRSWFLKSRNKAKNNMKIFVKIFWIVGFSITMFFAIYAAKQQDIYRELLLLFFAYVSLCAIRDVDRYYE